MEFAVEFRNITKSFGSTVANHDISFGIKKGEILSLLGENGSGKTTLMNMLSGIYFPDSGSILINGEPVTIASPKDAYKLHIGMVHQHFKLVDVFTAVENVVLGLTREDFKSNAEQLRERRAAEFEQLRQKGGILADYKINKTVKDNKIKEKYDLKNAAERIKEICDKYGFKIDPYKKIYDMSVSEKQTLEIIKVLYRGADILILDEPTAVLTPQESQKLFNVMRNMKADGKSIIIITHKLQEVLEISDRVAILRKGEYIDTVDTKEATEQSLTEMMVGEKVELNIERPTPNDPQPKLRVSHLSVRDKEGVLKLTDVSFEARSGEILGIAGISGCGQKELLEAIAGLQIADKGSSVIFINPDGNEEQLIGRTPKAIREMGVALSFVPEDRLGMGLVGSMGMVENMMLKTYTKPAGLFMHPKRGRQLAEEVKDELEVVTPSVNTAVRKLSGGNVQKVLVGREIAYAPSILMTAYAVRGLDINTSYTIYRLLNEQKKKGVAVIYVGEDLDVLLALSDRILVLCGGLVNGILDGKTATKEQVGLLMTNLTEEAQAIKEEHLGTGKRTAHKEVANG